MVIYMSQKGLRQAGGVFRCLSGLSWLLLLLLCGNMTVNKLSNYLKNYLISCLHLGGSLRSEPGMRAFDFEDNQPWVRLEVGGFKFWAQ